MEELRKLITKWRKPQGDCAEDNHAHDCFCPVFDECADELEALLPAVERELEDMKQRLANFEREGPLTPTGVELLERGVRMGLEWAYQRVAWLKEVDPAQIVSDAEAKGG